MIIKFLNNANSYPRKINFCLYADGENVYTAAPYVDNSEKDIQIFSFENLTVWCTNLIYKLFSYTWFTNNLFLCPCAFKFMQDLHLSSEDTKNKPLKNLIVNVDMW